MTVPMPPAMKTPEPEPSPDPSFPRLEIDPPTLFVTLPPARSTTASTPEIEPVLLTAPLLAR